MTPTPPRGTTPLLLGFMHDPRPGADCSVIYRYITLPSIAIVATVFCLQHTPFTHSLGGDHRKLGSLPEWIRLATPRLQTNARRVRKSLEFLYYVGLGVVALFISAHLWLLFHCKCDICCVGGW
jgi:hypothetical protein